MEQISKISLLSLKRAIAARWPLVLIVSAGVFALIAAHVLSLAPRYAAEALLLLAPEGEALRGQSAGGAVAPQDILYVRSELAILTSDGLARRIIEERRLADLPEFQSSPGMLDGVKSRVKAAFRRAPATGGMAAEQGLSAEEVRNEQVLQGYKARLMVFNDGRSEAVRLGFTASSPRLAAELANAHADAYLKEQSSRRLSAQQQAIGWLKQEVDARAKEVLEADTRVKEYQLSRGVVGSRDGTMVEQRLSQLNEQLGEARRELSSQVSLLTEVRRARATGDAQRAAALLKSEPLIDLQRKRVEAEANVAALADRLAPRHPSLIKARQELASVNDTINRQLQRVEVEAESGVSSWQSQVNDLSTAVQAETARKVSEDRAVAGVPALMAQADVKRAVFETVLSRYQTLLAEQSFSAPSALIVSRAVAPLMPSFPKTNLFLVMGAMAAALAGALAAVLYDLLRPASAGLNAIADAVGVRPLVAIPRFRNAARADGAIEIDDPSLFIESIRSVRNAILERLQTHSSTTCLITSMLPRQGKSLVAMSVARAIARAHGRTLFIDADLRRPRGAMLARRAAPEIGIAAVLQGRASLEDAIVTDESSGLDMLLAEENASSAVDHLTNLALNQLFAPLRERYDAIIIDSPPMGLVADALAISSAVDQTIVVARDGKTSLAELAQGVRMLKERGANLAGLVLTGVDASGLVATDRATLHGYAVGIPAEPASRRPE